MPFRWFIFLPLLVLITFIKKVPWTMKGSSYMFLIRSASVTDKCNFEEKKLETTEWNCSCIYHFKTRCMKWRKALKLKALRASYMSLSRKVRMRYPIRRLPLTKQLRRRNCKLLAWKLANLCERPWKLLRHQMLLA